MGSNLPVGRNLNSAINDAGNKSGVKEKVNIYLIFLRLFEPIDSQSL
jgi:hypothetical protein